MEAFGRGGASVTTYVVIDPELIAKELVVGISVFLVWRTHRVLTLSMLQRCVPKGLELAEWQFTTLSDDASAKGALR